MPGTPFEEADLEMALWWALEYDPLVELRAISDRNRSVPPNPFGIHDGDALRAKVVALPTPELAEVLDRYSLSSALTAGLSMVCQAPEFDAILDPPDAPDHIDSEPLVRAIVAATLHAASASAGFGLPGSIRDDLLDAVRDALGGNVRSGGAIMSRALIELAMRAGGSRWVDHNRMGWTTSAAPAAGDVLKYLARGAGIRDYIADRITSLTGPVVVLAHSLGGIAALELLAARPLRQVTHLITVGSQAPFLYELDALPTLPYPLPLPASVPRWTNIYDRRDLLGYRGSGLFGARIRDIEVDNRVPFPAAHSAYFSRDNKGFYDVLDGILR